MNWRPLLLSALVLVSVLAGGISVGSGPAAAGPPGYLNLANDQIQEDIPAEINPKLPINDSELLDRSRGNVLASEHSSTLNATWRVLNSQSGEYVDQNAANAIIKGSDKVPLEIVLVLEDGQAHDGRKVAIPVELLEEAVGHRPEMAYGLHEDGSTWETPITVDEGMAIFEVPKFSSNVVEFSGEVRLTGTYTDGSQIKFNITDPDSTSDITIQATGKVNGEYDNETGAGVGVDHTASIDVYQDGLEPTDGNGGNPVLEVTRSSEGPLILDNIDMNGDGNAEATRTFAGDDQNGEYYTSEMKVVPNQSMTVGEIQIYVSNVAGANYGATVEVYINQGDPDQIGGQGTNVATWDPDWSTGVQSIPLDTSYSVTSGTSYTIELVTQSSDGDGNIDHLQLDLDDSPSTNWFAYEDDGSWASEPVMPNVSLVDNRNVNDLSVTDGAGHSHTFGNFSTGETKSTSIDIAGSSNTLDFTGSGTGSFDYKLTLKERVQTQDPGVDYNNESVTFSGTIADGETVTKTINKSAIQAGENTVNVSLPSLSADAPPMQVDLNVTHDSTDEIVTGYDAEKFSERYNVSKTYASDRTNPSLTIPFAGNVISLRDLEYRVNGGSWQTLSDYTLSGTELTGNLPDVTAGDSVTVRANGTKVSVGNGEIKVEEPTPVGSTLDTEISVTSANESEDLTLGLGGTPDADLAHETYQESWTADEYAIKTTSAHHLYLPDAAQGSTFRIKTAPLKVVPRSNEVIYEIPDDSDSQEPKIEISPGSTSGDTIDLTFTGAADEQHYILKSLTFGTQRDEGTASSPLTLTDDDSDEVLQFQEEDSGSSTDGTDGTSSTFWEDGQKQVEKYVPAVDPKLIALLMIAIVGLAVFYTEEDDELDDKPVYKRQLVWFAVGMAFLFGLVFLDPRAFTGPLQTMLDATLPLAGVMGVLALLISVILWWRKRQTEAETPDTVFKVGGETVAGTEDPDEESGGWL